MFKKAKVYFSQLVYAPLWAWCIMAFFAGSGIVHWENNLRYIYQLLRLKRELDD